MFIYRVRLKDQTGQFWLQAEQLWSEDIAYAQPFTDLSAAEVAASEARYRAKNNPDWFPKIQTVQFRV